MAESDPLSRLSIFASERQTYDRARQVGIRAAVSESVEPERLRKAISRLDAFLAGGRPPRMDVPPGFYFNEKI